MLTNKSNSVVVELLRKIIQAGLLFAACALLAGCLAEEEDGNQGIYQDDYVNPGNNTGTGTKGNNATGNATTTNPETYFLEVDDNFTHLGDWWVQEFSLSQSTSFAFRFASQYSADAAIFTADQQSNFTENWAFSGLNIFNGQFGTHYITLPAGRYVLGMRSRIASANAVRMELDIQVNLPPSDGFRFYDMYIQGSRAVDAGGLLWQPFEIQDGFRYFVDGCNTGLEAFVLPASEFAGFQSNTAFNYFVDYSGTESSQPGFIEIKLPPGSYYLAFRNPTNSPHSVTYSLERWIRK